MPRVTEVIDEKHGPVSIHFENPCIDTEDNGFMESAMFQNKKTGEYILGLGTSNVAYAGEVTSRDGYNTFLVLENEDSHKCKLIKLSTCLVTPLLEQDPNRESSAKPTESLGLLRKKFGSKKAKRYTEQQERLAMNVENVKETLEQTVADVTVQEVIPETSVDGTSHYMPKINREALSKNRVYLLEDLVPEDVLASLNDKLTEILDSEDLDQFSLAPCVTRNIKKLRDLDLPQSVLVDKGKILLFAHYMITFINTPVKAMTRKYIACDCSVEVDRHIRQNYMINNTRPLTMKDKSLCYLIVLLMIAMDYELSLEDLAKDVKIGLKKMQELARNLGFSLSTANKKHILLKIPVPPPVTFTLKRKR